MNSREHHSGLTVAFLLLVVLIVFGLSATMQRAHGAELDELLCPAAGTDYCGKCYQDEFIGPIPYAADRLRARVLASIRSPQVRAPEIDPAGATGALTLLGGLLVIIRGKK